jgi:hypothetical protein
MNKKIFVISILSVFMLIAISFVTVVSSNTTTIVKKKESPLFWIRTRLNSGERLENLKENIKVKYIGQRLFFLPFQFLKNGESFSTRDFIIMETMKDEYTKALGCCPTYTKTCLGS